MAYATSNPPALVSQRVGASGGAIWVYKDGDPLNTVLGANYVSNGSALGMVAGDIVHFIDSTNVVSTYLQVVSVTAGGAATLGLASATGSVESLTAATKSVTALENGTTFLLNKADGITVTLPSPVVGLKYKFVVQTAVTSNDYGMDTDGASTFLAGSINQIIAASATSEGQVADGTSIVSLNMNGSTTGGLVGSWHTVEAISSTVWWVDGIHVGSGTLATGFA